jgi:CheY-like chemotaxis protein
MGDDHPARFIALTGYGQQHDEAESRAAGFHHHLVKPVDVDRIAALLDG